MTSVQILGFLLLGGVIGTISGMLGIGGGVLVIPAMMFFFGLTQRQAVGTSLGMLLPPIGFFAFYQYYQAGQTKLLPAGLLAIGFALGAWGGALLVTSGKVPEKALRIGFAIFMLYVAGSMLFRSERRVWAVIHTLLLAAGFGFAYLLFRIIGKRWDREFAMDKAYREHVQSEMPPDYEI
jgi:uncharacterized membrane protein YfcA